MNKQLTDDLITSHMSLVGHIVRETMSRVPVHVNRDDLTSAGLTALVQAGQAYEAERGVPFARYASTRIRGAVLDELRSMDWASRSVRRRARDLDAARSEIAAATGRIPSNTDVAAVLGISTEEVSANAEDVARAQVLSLQGSGDTPLDVVILSSTPTPEQLVENKERLDYLVEAIAELPDRLRTVVQDYFLVERPMAEIAVELGVSESRVSQMRAEALTLLRGALTQALEPELMSAPTRPDGCASRRREAYYAAVATRHTANVRRPVLATVTDQTA